MQLPLVRLQCNCNSYDWGKKGSDSAAARYAAASSPDFTIQEDRPYAELWMGTHPSNPSKDADTGCTLLDLVQDNQMLLSPEIAQKYGNRLPFLFKVLSMRTAASIQAHPNKSLAKQLHDRDPKNYPDDNHKPEMVIAISPVEGLCGFRPLKEIAHFLKAVPSLRQLVGDEEAKALEGASHIRQSDGKIALKNAFTSLMKSSSDDVKQAASKLLKQAQDEGPRFAGGDENIPSCDELANVIIRLNDQFPADIGLFVVLFLNYIKLQPGDAMFLRADDIHAYICGDMLECMASSDNVVRAGFTPKFKDVDTLTSMLTYNYAPFTEQMMKPSNYDNCKFSSKGTGTATLYDPPIEEFSVVRMTLDLPGASVTFEPIEGPSVVICTQGNGTITVGSTTKELKEGYVYFVGATAQLKMTNTGKGRERLVASKAFCVL
ncbi:mannose-6-phosphate isomerase [Piedraia hortae CBS 480.64]|uniref:Mannose-6-phosphate isomerase n=1 Tax=Piedraia hortae CBS 480.64 TaxID=1314780 RepID=A0A6A7C2K4_9PEZI|nr:mannose-6-phosphate isomerase [Piedraia hortae CBS 480.64]